MLARATTDPTANAGADTAAVGVFDGEKIAHDVDGALQALLDSGEARTKFRHVAVTHAAGMRWIVVGLGAREEFGAERARRAAAAVQARAGELGTRVLCWELPHHVGDEIAAGVVEGTLLSAYRFERYKTAADVKPPRLEELLVSDHDDRSAPVEIGAVVAEAANAARDLQNTPANEMTPTHLARHAQELAAAHPGLEVEVEGLEQIAGRGMGAFAAVAHGSHEEPALIVLRYEPETAGKDRPVLGLVGKAVTFDTGGISIKPAGKMHEMKFDMSGGAAVIEAMGAIARLKLPIRVIAVVGATENMPSGHAMRPGDIVRAMTGTTIEINNTDAEGRLVLADCLAHAVALGAERLVDVATLTGAVVVALGTAYAGLMANDDAWAAAVEDAGRRAGEPLWRLPLHEDYDELIRGRYGDIVNAAEKRQAGSSVAAQFLSRFVGDVPWAHLDIAATAWDNDRPYAGKGGSGWGVHTLVALARSQSTA